MSILNHWHIWQCLYWTLQPTAGLTLVYWSVVITSTTHAIWLAVLYAHIVHVHLVDVVLVDNVKSDIIWVYCVEITRSLISACVVELCWLQPPVSGRTHARSRTRTHACTPPPTHIHTHIPRCRFQLSVCTSPTSSRGESTDDKAGLSWLIIQYADCRGLSLTLFRHSVCSSVQQIPAAFLCHGCYLFRCTTLAFLSCCCQWMFIPM